MDDEFDPWPHDELDRDHDEPYEPDDLDDSMDGDHDSAMASVGWGTAEDYGGWDDIEF